MKKVLDRWRMIVMAFLMMSVASITTTKAQGSISLQVFYDELQPYGTWMDYGSYGYVWIPSVERGFTPYATNGYWIQTEYGNTWVSDYAWGWAPFHYGRWLFDDFYGWIWVPDTEWGPAWVAWRNGGGYYGWAPLMPGHGIHLTFNYYNRIPHYYWNFVPHRYIMYRHVYRHCAPRPQVVNIIHNTTIVTHNYTDNRRHTYFTGPSRREIEQTNRQRVEVYNISDKGRPGRTEVARGRANFYKPEIDNSRDARTKSVPSTFVRKNRDGNLEQVETRRQRTSEIPATRRTDDFRYNARPDGNETEERKRTEVIREVPQREYTPAQRTPQREFENRNPSRQPVQREKTPLTRDPQDFNQRERAPQIQRQNEPDQNVQRERAPAIRDVERRTSTQPQFERQNTNRQQENLQRQRPSDNPNPSRSSTGPSQRQQQFQKSNSDNSSRQPARSTNSSRQSELRKRN